jgi:membrane protein YdbS with pleckstrin-like domain
MRGGAMPSDNAAFSVRPVFVGWTTLLVQAPFQLFFAVWAGIFFGGIGASIFGLKAQTPFVTAFGALAFIIVPLVAFFGKKLNYGRTEYRFYSDRLEFDEGFFSINRKAIKFQDVKEVTLRKGFLQRIYGLGTIYLATLATGSTANVNPFGVLGFGNVSASGVSVRDIANPDAMFEKIRTIVDARS